MEVKIMSQIDDLNKAIADEDVEIQDVLTSVTKINADVDALLAKIAAGATIPDITTQLQAIQAHTAALTTASQQLKDEDAKANA
jgi:DNA-binding FrmR family transcriptional regulator